MYIRLSLSTRPSYRTSYSKIEPPNIQRAAPPNMCGRGAAKKRSQPSVLRTIRPGARLRRPRMLESLTLRKARRSVIFNFGGFREAAARRNSWAPLYIELEGPAPDVIVLMLGRIRHCESLQRPKGNRRQNTRKTNTAKTGVFLHYFL